MEQTGVNVIDANKLAEAIPRVIVKVSAHVVQDEQSLFARPKRRTFGQEVQGNCLFAVVRNIEFIE